MPSVPRPPAGYTETMPWEETFGDNLTSSSLVFLLKLSDNKCSIFRFDRSISTKFRRYSVRQGRRRPPTKSLPPPIERRKGREGGERRKEGRWVNGLTGCLGEPPYTWMGDLLRADKPSRYVICHLGHDHLSLLSLRGR